MVNLARRQEQNSDIALWNDRQIRLIKEQICPKITDDELALFAQVCKRTGLDPFSRQIYAVKRRDYSGGGSEEKMTIQTGIDGYRLIADRTGQYAGSDAPLFDEGLTLYDHIQSERGHPIVATVTVWKLVGGVRCSFTGQAAWDEFVQQTTDKESRQKRPNSMWAKMGHNMLAKAAEAQALRKAFPAQTSDLAVGEPPQDEPLPLDYLRSDIWARFTRAMFDAQTADRVNECVAGAYALVEQGQLPEIARQSIEREADVALQRLSTLV